MAGFQVQVGLQHQAQRHRLGPEIAFDLETQRVVVHLGRRPGAHSQAVAQDPRFEGGNGLVDQGFQGRDIDVRRAVAGQCRQAEIHHRGARRGMQRGIGAEQ
ncbi:hypothetical protein D3C80_1976070 [compost metagenome]